MASPSSLPDDDGKKKKMMMMETVNDNTVTIINSADGAAAAAASATITTTTSTRSSSNASSVWDMYREWAKQNQSMVWFIDESISRILFWTTPSSSSSSSWREACFGILELHRSLFDLACQQQDDPNTVTDSYGMTVHVNVTSNKYIRANSIRFALTILQSLWPIIQELIILGTNNSNNNNTVIIQQKQAMVRKYIERIRFLLRCTLLISYWNESKSKKSIWSGIQQYGGLYHPNNMNTTNTTIIPPTIEQEYERIKRYNYKGIHTGKRIVPIINNIEYIETNTIHVKLRIILGELLYVIRPLYQAEMDYNNNNTITTNNNMNKLRTWIICILMDILSLISLQYTKQTGNISTQNEYKRRKLRLSLYLLRTPIWEYVTQRSVQSISNILTSYIPIIGNLTNNYLWDYIYYWKLYRAEEG